MYSGLVGNNKSLKRQYGECRPRTWHIPEHVRGERTFQNLKRVSEHSGIYFKIVLK